VTNPNNLVETSAARLLGILREAKSTDMGKAAIEMWCQVFGIEMGSNEETYPKFFRSAADLITLSQIVKNQVGDLATLEHEDVDFALEDYHKIEAVMARFANVTQQSMQQTSTCSTEMLNDACGTST
jgi:hypothetical protein